MCGIAGLYDFEGAHDRATLAGWASAMADGMVHRGPDDHGVWLSENGRCCFAHRRLSIIDPSPAGHQPMESPEPRAAITFNGEIYNHNELRHAVEAGGHRLRTRTDTEVLLQAMLLWGVDAFRRLDGMYAFALYRESDGVLWMARDPFGEKPLYYTSDGRVLAFASELQPLQRLPFFDDEVSDDAIAEFLSFQYLGAPRTLYRSVHKLPPGCFLRVFPDGRLVPQRYFEFTPRSPAAAGAVAADADALTDELEDILVRSIRRRMIADVPLGAFLSGGVDSSTVCALIRKTLDVPLKTFSVGFTDSEESEHVQARRYADYLRTEHHEKHVTPDATSFLLRAGDYLDEPNGDTSCLPTFLLSGFAREHVTVAISGDGGDEMFGGYRRYLIALRKMRRALRRGRPEDSGERYYGDLILIFPDEHIRELFGLVPAGLDATLSRLRAFVDRPNPSVDLLMRMRKTDIDNYLPGAVLAKVDRMSMRHSLEVRTPFLSIELARFVERLPTELLCGAGQGKLLLKKLARRYLPGDWLDLPKRGFGLPVTQGWGEQHLLGVVADLLRDRASVLSTVFGREGVERFLRRQRERPHLYQLWAMGTLESYLRARPARVHRFESEVPVQRVETDGAPPVAHRVIDHARERNLPIVWFCRNGVPKGWRRCDGGATAVVPFPMAAEPGLAVVQADWERPDGSGLDALAGKVAPGAIALFSEPAVERCLTPRFCEGLIGLGFGHLALGTPETPGTALLDLAEYGKVVRRCGRAWRPPGRRVGPWWRPFRPSGGYLFRTRWPLFSRRSGQSIDSRRFAVIERRLPLLLADCSLEEIRDEGRGRFKVRDDRLWLSSSDNSDAARNRRAYRLLDLTGQGLAPWWNANDTATRTDRHTRALAAHLLRDNATLDRTPTPPKPGDTVALVTASLFSGGAERQWISLGRGLLARGFRVVLLVFDLTGENAHYLDLARECSLEVHDLSLPEPADGCAPRVVLSREAAGLAAWAPPQFRRTLWRILRAFRSMRPDYVACQLDHPNIVGGLASVLGGARRVLLSFRNVNPSKIPYLNRPWFRDYYRTLIASDRVVLTGNSAFGNRDYADWLGIEPSRIKTIPNGFVRDSFDDVAPGAIDAFREQHEVPSGSRIVCGLFRLSVEKDPATFLDVAGRITATRPDLVVLHAGAGPLVGPMRRKARQMGLSNRVRFLGPIENPSVLLKASELVLMTSLAEGISNVLLEAQYLGVPVVATGVGGTPEAVVDGETGLLVDPGDADAIARRCLDLLEDPELRERMGRKGRSRVESEFGMDSFLDRTLESLSTS